MVVEQHWINRNDLFLLGSCVMNLLLLIKPHEMFGGWTNDLRKQLPVWRGVYLIWWLFDYLIADARRKKTKQNRKINQRQHPCNIRLITVHTESLRFDRDTKRPVDEEEMKTKQAKRKKGKNGKSEMWKKRLNESKRSRSVNTAVMRNACMKSETIVDSGNGTWCNTTWRIIEH